MKKLNKRAGFTLAELLIVVAIIAILVAIGIPAFSTAMERSRETVDLANIRGAYAEYIADSLSTGANTKTAYEIDFKQKELTKPSDTNGWVADVTGFLPNVVTAGGKMPAVPASGKGFAIFEYTVGSGDKPTLTLASTAPSGSGDKIVSKNGDVTVIS